MFLILDYVIAKYLYTLTLPYKNFVIFFAEYFPYIFITAVIFLWLYVFKVSKNYLGLLIVTSVIVSRFLALPIIRLIVQRPRPYLFDLDIEPLVDATGYSFPSGHATVFFALATAVYLWNKKVGFVFLFGALLIALGRVFAGVHYPLDVFVGALLGITVTFFISKFVSPKS